MRPRIRHRTLFVLYSILGTLNPRKSPHFWGIWGIVRKLVSDTFDLRSLAVITHAYNARISETASDYFRLSPIVLLIKSESRGQTVITWDGQSHVGFPISGTGSQKLTRYRTLSMRRSSLPKCLVARPSYTQKATMSETIRTENHYSIIKKRVTNSYDSVSRTSLAPVSLSGMP